MAAAQVTRPVLPAARGPGVTPNRWRIERCASWPNPSSPRRAGPLPTPSRQCHEAFDRRDSGWLFAGLCSVCESNRLEGMIIAVVYAPDRKAVNIALKAIKRLRNLVK